MYPTYNQRPWAVKMPLPVGVVPTGLARHVFGDDFLWGESYYSDGKFIRRIVFEDEARGLDLNFYFDGTECRNGHIAPRKLRRGRNETQCIVCRRLARKRSRNLKQQETV